MNSTESPKTPQRQLQDFRTTHWSLVLAAGDGDVAGAREALDRLCQAYWYPIYAYVRRKGHPPDDAEDLTQEFFLQLLEHHWVARADRSRGRFRSFLLMALNRFLANAWDRTQTEKRGGNWRRVPFSRDDAEGRFSREPVETRTPEQEFEKQWALTLLEHVLNVLREEYAERDRGAIFDALKPSLVGRRETQPYQALGATLGMTEGSVKVAVFRLRQRYRERLLEEIAHTVASPHEVESELRHLFRALAKLNHPHIVTIHDFGRADGLFYLVMEYVDGVNLRQLLQTGGVSPREALAIVPQICDALQYAHDQGVVHRDIKPENVLLDRLGRVKVADFGLAKLMGTVTEPAAGQSPAVGAVSWTEAGHVMGTPQYMAPEQHDHPAAVDHRADIYSLGVVFYQLLTGELPHGRIEPPSRKVRIDVRLDQVVLRALEKEPRRRYQQVSHVKVDVETITSTPALEPPAWRQRLFRSKAVVFWGGCLVLLCAVVILLRMVLVEFQRRQWRAAHDVDRAERAERVMLEWLPRLLDGNAEARTQAALHIHDQGIWAQPTVPGLILALKDEHYLVRMLCAETLGFVGEQAGLEASQALHRALSDSDQRVRVCAAVALTKVDHTTTANLPVLIDTLTHRPSDDVATTVWPVQRREAAEALGRMGGRARPALPALRARIGEPGVSEAIEQIEKGDGTVSGNARPPRGNER